MSGRFRFTFGAWPGGDAVIDVVAASCRKHMDRQTQKGSGLAAVDFVDVGVLNFGAVNDRDGASADHFHLLVVLEHDGRVFVDADADQKRVHRDGGEEPADAMALREVLIDDELARQTEARREHHARTQPQYPRH